MENIQPQKRQYVNSREICSQRTSLKLQTLIRLGRRVLWRNEKRGRGGGITNFNAMLFSSTWEVTRNARHTGPRVYWSAARVQFWLRDPVRANAIDHLTMGEESLHRCRRAWISDIVKRSFHSSPSMGLQRNDVAVSAGLTDRKYWEIDESYGFYKVLNFRLNNLISRYDGEETYLLSSYKRKFHSCFPANPSWHS